MQFIDLSLPTPEENLACDEVLLELRQRDNGPEILRVWESPQPFVVLGYGNKTADEVDLESCRKLALPVLRRSSGGGSVLEGPGCLNFSLILKIPPEGPLTDIVKTNAWITQRHAEALAAHFGQDIRSQGLSDVTVGPLKISGNAQRRKKRWILFHGTFLLDFELPLIERTLAIPKRQPEYRSNRPHLEFVTNFRTPREEVVTVLRKEWQAFDPLNSVPEAEITRLARERYHSDGWNFRV